MSPWFHFFWGRAREWRCQTPRERDGQRAGGGEAALHSGHVLCTLPAAHGVLTSLRPRQHSLLAGSGLFL